MTTTVPLGVFNVGDVWEQPLQIQVTGTDMSGVVVACSILRPDNTKLALTGLTPTFIDDPDNTTFSVVLALTAAQTIEIGPGPVSGDVVIEKAGFGPYTPVRFTFDLKNRITPNP